MPKSTSNKVKSTSTKRREEEHSATDMASPLKSGITAISVRGYKSLAEKSEIEIRPLTLLAGSNSSGKSSITQPVLLMKQTLEATYDPGALLLNGPNLKFTAANQLFSKLASREVQSEFEVGLEIYGSISISNVFGKRSKKKNLELIAMTYKNTLENFEISFHDGMNNNDIFEALSEKTKSFLANFISQTANIAPEFWLGNEKGEREIGLEIIRSRCFLEMALSAPGRKRVTLSGLLYGDLSSTIERQIQEIIHVPGLRGNPSRTYRTTAVGSTFPGTFENYVASVIRSWQDSKKNKVHLKNLGRWLEKLGLTCRVETRKIDDTQVELRVGRLTESTDGRRKDMVNIADVGFGVSQVLPVLVSLLVARPGQLVYIEQPEIHLHPRAQAALAEILCDAARRGVKVVAETHSESLLIAIQSLVAEGVMPSELVKLHWFTRGDDGVTQISSADLDEAGAFGEWPEDFAEVSMALENRYLSAAESRLWN